MSIASKLQDILAAKSDIKDAINAKGGTITDATPLDEYAQAIDNLPSGDEWKIIWFIEGGITTLDIPSGTTKIGNYLFYGWGSLVKVNIPTSVTTIGSYVFYGTSIRTLVIPDSVTSVDRNSLSVTNNLVDITFGSGVTELGMNMFQSKTRKLDFNIRMLSTTPPTLGAGFVPTDFTGKIYVPDESVSAYKAATNWSTWAAYIYPMSDYTPKE